MIKRINISLAGLLCLGGQYEHILCTSAAPTTNDTICQTEDDLDYISCNLEDLSDAALSEICINARQMVTSSEWLKVKDGISPIHDDYISDAENCIYIKEKIQLHLLKMTLIPDGKLQRFNNKLKEFMMESFLESEDISADILFHIEMIRSSKQLRHDPWDYINELSQHTEPIGGYDDDTFREQFFRNRKIIEFIAVTILETTMKDWADKERNTRLFGDVNYDKDKDSVGTACLSAIAMSIISFFFYIIMLTNKSKDNETEEQKKSTKMGKKKKKN